uniref:OCRE domain-containing protein n=2 Tax=Kalanchoe fedtschenkoi TaxID=63787 RepID=A0A7N1A080_KALFE
MAESSRPSKKRDFAFDGDDADDKQQPPQKRVKFPKGKKVKSGDQYVAPAPEIKVPTAPVEPHLAATERAQRRSQLTTELFIEEHRGLPNDITAAEVEYEDNETFEDDGIQIEPFNLKQERNEGYFDDAGNFVEYVDDQAFKDPWLDSVEVDTRYAEKASALNIASNETHELESDDIGKMKRRIADILNPDETVLQALRRLKGTSNRKEKMSADKKFMFDQLTEDAMKLLENGDYNVYEEKKEVFEREAEGYERLAKARGNESSVVAAEIAGILEAVPGPSGTEVVLNDGDDLDMFAEDDEQTNTTSVPPATASNAYGQLSSDVSISDAASQNDFVYDESSGYYYSSTLGYYYDASSGLYCCAASGQWYSYNAETGTYDEVQGDTSAGAGVPSAAAAEV